MPGVPVKLTHDLTMQVRIFTSDLSGSFVFANVLPGDYSIHVSREGFNSYNQKAIRVGAQASVDLHEIRLQVGDVATSIQVQTEASHVATDSSDRSIELNRVTIENTPLRGRDYLGILRTLPGVAATTTSEQPAWNSSGAAINGGTAGQVLITLDGIASQNSGFNATNTAAYLSPSVEAIGEVKVMVSNYNGGVWGTVGRPVQCLYQERHYPVPRVCV